MRRRSYRRNPDDRAALDGTRFGIRANTSRFAIQRRFAIGERASAEIRVEAYNIANQAFFADPARFLTNPLFGQSLSHTNLLLGTGRPHSGLTPALQPGGPRTVQFRVDFRF